MYIISNKHRYIKSYSSSSSKTKSISSTALRNHPFWELSLRHFNSNLSISRAISTLSLTAINNLSTTGNVGKSWAEIKIPVLIFNSKLVDNITVTFIHLLRPSVLHNLL